MVDRSSAVVPRVLFSRCLGYEACRFNGGIVQDPTVERLKDFVEAETVCPEVEIGLGIPRKPIRLVGSPTAPRLVQLETGRDVTDAMKTYASDHLGGLDAPDGFVLKYASPSCGPRDVRCYVNDQRGAAFAKTQGLFGEAVTQRFPHCPVEDEGRLKNFDIRQHFFTHARFRKARTSGKMHDLVGFHTRHKLLLLAYSEKHFRELGRVVANEAHVPPADVFTAYADGLHAATGRAPRRTSAINVLQHAFGYVSDRLTREEKAFFLDTITQYRSRRVPLSVPTSLLRSWIIRFEVTYLADQVYFEPFPRGLIEVLDSGKGRTLG